MRVRVSQPLAPLPSCKLSCGAFRRIARLPLARVRDDRLRMSPPTCRRAGRRHAGLVIHRTGPHATLLSAPAPPAPQTEPGPDGFALKDTFGRTDARFKDNFFCRERGKRKRAVATRTAACTVFLHAHSTVPLEAWYEKSFLVQSRTTCRGSFICRRSLRSYGGGGRSSHRGPQRGDVRRYRRLRAP